MRFVGFGSTRGWSNAGGRGLASGYDENYHTFFRVPEGSIARVYIDAMSLRISQANGASGGLYSPQWMFGHAFMGINIDGPAVFDRVYNSVGAIDQHPDLHDQDLMRVSEDRLEFVPELWVGTTAVDAIRPSGADEASSDYTQSGGSHSISHPREFMLNSGEEIAFRVVSNASFALLGVSCIGRAELFDE
jgi:hypothetical protein